MREFGYFLLAGTITVLPPTGIMIAILGLATNDTNLILVGISFILVTQYFLLWMIYQRLVK